MLCLTADIPSAFIGRGRGILHELPDQIATLASITKSASRVDHPSQAGAAVAEAFKRMRSGRPGPVALAAPWDVLGQRAPVKLHAPLPLAEAPLVDMDVIERAVALIRDARNPMISVGAGAMHAGEEILQLAQLLQAPVAAHRRARRGERGAALWHVLCQRARIMDADRFGHRHR